MKAAIRFIPNGVTIFRITGSIVLLFLNPMNMDFICIYFLCGLSDILDGFLARAFHFESKHGAILDSMADTLFIFVCFCKLFPFFNIPLWGWIWCAVVAVIKISTLRLIHQKCGHFGYSSSWSNKIAGFVLFLAPVFTLIIDIRCIALIVGVVTTFAAIREHRKER